MAVSLDDFRVPYFDPAAEAPATSRQRFSLSDYDTAVTPFLDTGKAAKEGKRDNKQDNKQAGKDDAKDNAKDDARDDSKARLDEIGARLDAIQQRLFASQSKRVLLVLQGMDTSGKDSTIRAVFHDVNPAGVNVVSFKAPTAQEAAHDFLWRVHPHAPAAGEIAVFNRSHYEDVLVPRVKRTLEAEGVQRRFEQIRQFEALLADNNTTILKCFLHISKETQRERLQERIDDPKKHWKFDPSDVEARRYWDDYQSAYAQALAATSTPHAPWYIVPADSKPHRKLMVAELVLRVLESLDVHYPPARPELVGIKID